MNHADGPENSGERISLVIPARNAVSTLRRCLDAVTPLLGKDGLDEILLVDDGSTDDTPRIAAEYPVRVLSGGGRGPGAARNVGWRAARNPLVWFIDSDCVAEPGALRLLLPHLADPAVAGAGGSYGNMRPDSRLASLIHEEIAARHARMPADVNYLATFNVIYRRDALERVGGFDEGRFNGPGAPGAEDIELAFRLHDAGYRLRFEVRSLVGHFHPTRPLRYLRSQRLHGYFRVRLYLEHPNRAAGDSYSGPVDHLQPPLAMLTLATLPLALFGNFFWVPLLLAALLFAAQLPLTARLVRRRPACWSFPLLGFPRAFWRGAGMTQAVLARLLAPRGAAPSDNLSRHPPLPAEGNPGS
jgi:GT2 family glycosyltransferase